jgi:hypothetical protein
MTESELWEAYSARNPSFANEEGTVTMSASGLRKLFKQTWSIAHDSGYRRGLKEATESANRESRMRDNRGDMGRSDIFSQIFGNGFPRK